MPRISIPYTPPPYLYLPSGWDSTWRAAKAAAGSTPAWIFGLGDSIIGGTGASDCMTKSFFRLLRAQILKSFSLYGDFWYAGLTASTWYNGAGNNGSSASFPWTWAGTYGIFPGSGFSFAVNASGSAWTGTFTTPYACTALDILYADVGAMQWSYQVDGGAATTVTQVSSNLVKKVALSGLANTTHTVTLTWVASTGQGPIGITTYNPASAGGIGFGWQAQGYGSTGIGMLSQLGSGNSGTVLRALQGPTSGAINSTGLGFPTQPHLAILAMGINDCNRVAPNDQFFVNPDQYEIAWRRVVKSLRLGRPNCSILFLAPWNGDAAFADTNSGWQGDQWHLFKRAMLNIAEEESCAYFDVDARWGATPNAQGLVVSNTNAHPNDAGNADIASVLQGIL